MALKFYTCDKRIETKSQKDLEANSYVCRRYRGKTCRGGYFASPPIPFPFFLNLNTVKERKLLAIGYGNNFVNLDHKKSEK